MSNIPNPLKGTYHIANNPDLYEPMRQNTFELQVVFDDDELLMPDVDPTGEDLKYIEHGFASDVLRLAIKKDSVPSFEIGKIEVSHGNNKTKFAGKPTFNDTSLTAYEYIGRNAKYILQAWQHLAYNPHTQNVGRAKSYKKTAYLLEYTPDYELVSQIALYGCWLSSVTFTDYDGEQEGAKTCDATIVYDYFLPMDIKHRLESR